MLIRDIRLKKNLNKHVENLNKIVSESLPV